MFSKTKEDPFSILKVSSFLFLVINIISTLLFNARITSGFFELYFSKKISPFPLTLIIFSELILLETKERLILLALLRERSRL